MAKPSPRRRSARRAGAGWKMLCTILLGIALVFQSLQGLQDGTLTLPAWPVFSQGAASAAVSEKTSVHFLNVGQGDAALFLSGGQAVLIDASTATAADTIIRDLQELGVRKLDAVIASHPHADHIGGMRRVMQQFPTAAVYMPDAVSASKTYSGLLDEIERQHSRLIVPTIGQQLMLDSGARFTFLSPAPDTTYDDINDSSLVCMFEAGKTRVLMMGDAEKPVEQELLARRAKLSCNILKVGHHGSSSSSSYEFIRACDPDTAIISCAKVNDYGHPHAVTLKTLAKAGVKDIRYTYDGDIVFELS